MTTVSQTSSSTEHFLATLPGSYYTDPDIFALEQARIFAPMWSCVMRSSELQRAGQYRVVQVARESVVVVRGADGELRAFLNICRHRGARLCNDDCGEVRRSLQCAYHSWTYALDGKLIAAPNIATMPDDDRDSRGLLTVSLREWLGYVWLCAADQPPDFATSVVEQVTERLGDPAAVERYGVDELAVGRSVTYDVAANWKLIVENFMECYHCATIHPELVDVLPEFRQGFAAQYFVGHGAEFGEAIEGFTVDGRAGFAPLTGLDDAQDRRYYAITVRPQVFVNLVPDHVIVLMMTPLAADRTVVTCDWLFSPDVVESGDVDPSVELFHRVNLQDFAACEITQPAMSSAAYANGGVLVPSEHHIAAFHAWVRGLLGASST